MNQFDGMTVFTLKLTNCPRCKRLIKLMADNNIDGTLFALDCQDAEEQAKIRGFLCAYFLHKELRAAPAVALKNKDGFYEMFEGEEALRAVKDRLTTV